MAALKRFSLTGLVLPVVLVTLGVVAIAAFLSLKAALFAGAIFAAGLVLDTGLNCDYYSAGGGIGAGGAGAGSGDRQRLPRDEENRRVSETADSMRDQRDPTDPRAHNEYQEVRNFVNRCFGDSPVGSDHYPTPTPTPRDTGWTAKFEDVLSDPLGAAADAARNK